MKKIVKETEKKLKKLSDSIGDIEVSPVKRKPTFMTSEVIVLLILTSFVCIVLSGLITYNFISPKAEKVDDKLQSFLDNYNYILDNYYGKVNKEELLDAALAGMMESLDAGSSWMGSENSNFNIYLEGSYKGIGIEISSNDSGEIVASSVFKGSPADKAGIENGDIILKIQNIEVSGKNISEVSRLLKGNNKIEIIYKHNNEEKTVTLKSEKINLNSVKTKMLDNNIGYINVSIFASNTAEQFKRKLGILEKNGINGLIIDLRDNAGGHLTAARDILSLFLDSSHPIYKIKSKDDVETFYSSGKVTKKYKIVILVNENSASASEIVTSALKEQYGATVIGNKTYGKGTVQELQTLPDGQQYKLTTTIWLTSTGKSINNVGIEPDINVSLNTSNDGELVFDLDEQLKKAIEVLN